MESPGGVEPFDPTLEQIDDYKERFDYFCIAHGIAESAIPHKDWADYLFEAKDLGEPKEIF